MDLSKPTFSKTSQSMLTTVYTMRSTLVQEERTPLRQKSKDLLTASVMPDLHTFVSVYQHDIISKKWYNIILKLKRLKRIPVDDYPVLTSIARGLPWCQEMPQYIYTLPVDEIIEFVNNPPEIFQFPDVDWEEPTENLTSGLVCETPLEPVPAEPSPNIIGGQTVPIEHHPYIGKSGESRKLITN